jgi:DNA-binding protein YbaB|tara:strand:- start:1115 stop:2224 length:1110 start_codon:yes stop_codon:yes gene_type:complete
MEEEKLIKQIQTEQKFADVAHKSFREKKYGITSCCPFDLEKIAIKKYLCDWQSLKDSYPAPIVSLSSEIFIPSGPVDPCSDSNAPYWCVDCGYTEPPNASKTLELIAKYKQELLEMQDELATLTAENEEKTLQLKALNELLENLQTEEASLIEQIKVLQIDLKELFEQYEALDCLSNPTLPECLTLEVQIKDLDAQLAALTDQAKEKQTEIKEIQAQINNIEAEIEENNALIEELTVLINKTTDQLEQLQALFCDDSECIIIEVIDTNGNPIAGYPLVIDGGNIGQTDSSGTIVYSIPNASVNTQHTLEICYCFETAGDCRQQHITITVQGDECAPTCENPTPACSDITISETITGVIGSSGVPNPPAA